MNDRLLAVFNDFERENFLQRFNLSQEDCDVLFIGWNKHIIMTNNLVFLFPRNPSKLNLDDSNVAEASDFFIVP